MKFVSTASIVIRSGKGGDGIIAWRREKKVRRGGPSGGSGGRGGSVYIESDSNINSLFHIRHIRCFSAKNGENGRNKSQRGADAEDVVLKVPCGTKIFDKSTGEFLYEFIKNGDKYMACKGGAGGRGNCEFKSSKKPSPYLYELGDPAIQKEIFFDLQTISDVGFLGKPNAGKSSLLSAISNAKPKVAPFPFTTVIPVIGSVTLGSKKLTFSDIPGLIENASKGHGLGIEFLKHLNRCKLLLHIVDVSVDDVIREIQEIENEVKNYSIDLFSKKRILALNKIDLISEDKLFQITKNIKKQLNYEAFPISTISKSGIPNLLEEIFREFENISESPKQKIDYLEINDPSGLFETLEIQKNDNVWSVFHSKLKYWVYKIPRDTMDNVARLMGKCESLGVNQELLKAGAKKGDIVDIYGWKYDF